MHLLKPLDSESYRDYALRVLRHNIVTLEMVPGQMYSEKELAGALGLSRTPMREALIDLAKIKIVEIYPQRGTAVALVDYALVEEARFTREALECAVVEKCCEVMTPRSLSILELNLRQERYFRDERRLDELMQMDNAFHRHLFQAADKLLAYSLMSAMTIHFDRVRNMALESVTDFSFIEEHEGILDAIRHRDAQGAKARMHEHLNGYQVDAEGLRRVYPQYIKGA